MLKNRLQKTSPCPNLVHILGWREHSRSHGKDLQPAKDKRVLRGHFCKSETWKSNIYSKKEENGRRIKATSPNTQTTPSGDFLN